METRTERRTGVGLSRRTLLAGTAAAAGASAISWKVIAEQIETLKKEGWEANPVACKVCGGGCGLIIMKKTGVKPSLATVRVFPNPRIRSAACAGARLRPRCSGQAPTG